MNKDSMNIAKFSFINSIKSKGFIVFNIVLLIGIIIAINFSTVKTIFQSKDIFVSDPYNIYIIDDEKYLYNELNSQVGSNIETKKVNNVNKVELKKTDFASEVDNFTKEDVLIEVLEDDSGKYLKITSKEGIDLNVYNWILDVAKVKRNENIEAKYGINKADIEMYNSDVKVERNILEKDSVVDNKHQVLTMIMTMLIYSLIIFGTNAVASQIANEKTSKSAEYIFSAVPSKSYLNGKVLGANLKTVVNMFLIVFYLLMAIMINSALVKIFDVQTMNINNVNSENVQTIGSYISNIDVKVVKYIGLSFVYILLTSVLLSYIQAGMTAKVKSINEMDNSQSITLTMIVVAYIVGLLTSADNNLFTKIISNVPVLSMFTMPTKYLGGVASLKTIIPSLLLLLVTIVVVVNIVGKNFKNNILDLGTKKKGSKEVEEKNLLNVEISKIKKKEFKNFSLIIAFALISLVIVQMLLQFAVMILFPNLSNNMNMILTSLIFVTSFAVPIGIIKAMSNNCVEKNISTKRVSTMEKVIYFLMAIPIIFLSQYVTELIVGKFGINPTILETAINFDNTIISKILLFIELAILPAIFEEILFRKMILNEAKRFGVAFGMIFTGLAFGLIHMNVTQGINAVILGIIFSYITIKTKSILPAIGLHLFNNGLATLALIFKKNELATIIMTAIIWGSIAIGTLIILVKLVSNIKALTVHKKDEKTNKTSHKDEGNKIDLRLLFTDYYMIILIIFIITMFVITY